MVGAARQNCNHLLINPELIWGIYRVWAREPLSYAQLCCRHSFAWGFGFVWVGEFRCPSVEAFTPDMLSLRNIVMDSHITQTNLTVHLNASKTDPFGVGLHFTWGQEGTFSLW